MTWLKAENSIYLAYSFKKPFVTKNDPKKQNIPPKEHKYGQKHGRTFDDLIIFVSEKAQPK